MERQALTPSYRLCLPYHGLSTSSQRNRQCHPPGHGEAAPDPLRKLAGSQMTCDLFLDSSLNSQGCQLCRFRYHQHFCSRWLT